MQFAVGEDGKTTWKSSRLHWTLPADLAQTDRSHGPVDRLHKPLAVPLPRLPGQRVTQVTFLQP